MELGDWFNTAINALIGALLGSVAYGLAQLVADGAWVAAMRQDAVLELWPRAHWQE